MLEEQKINGGRELHAWSLFSGVGGFDLGLARAGIRVDLTCEIDPWRRRVLAGHFPDAKHTDDVRTLKGVPGATDILCGGFPCQDLSVAGQRAGLAGDRSGLFFEFARIAGELELAERGGWVFLENVPGLFSSNGGRDFGVVLETLADLGFAVGYRVLDSRHFGVPQRRRRVFIVGHSRADYARAVLFESEGSSRGAESGEATGPEVAGTLGGCSGSRGWCDDFDRNGAYVVVGAVPVEPLPSLTGLGTGGPDDNDGQAGRLNDEPTGLSDGEAYQCHGSNVGPMGALRTGNSGLTGTGSLVRRLTPRECERLQSFPDDWTAVDGLPVYAQAKGGSWRAKSGTPDSKRYSAMGDAVTVNVIEYIAHRLAAVDSGTPQPSPAQPSPAQPSQE
jgi:DNA (cytosine-5)-methyltransferase 1